jgi:hypothetical protein
MAQFVCSRQRADLVRLLEQPVADRQKQAGKGD